MSCFFSDSGLSSGAIAGIVVASILIIVLVAAIILLILHGRGVIFGKRGDKSSIPQSTTNVYENPPIVEYDSKYPKSNYIQEVFSPPPPLPDREMYDDKSDMIRDSYITPIQKGQSPSTYTNKAFQHNEQDPSRQSHRMISNNYEQSKLPLDGSSGVVAESIYITNPSAAYTNVREVDNNGNENGVTHESSSNDEVSRTNISGSNLGHRSACDVETDVLPDTNRHMKPDYINNDMTGTYGLSETNNGDIEVEKFILIGVCDI